MGKAETSQKKVGIAFTVLLVVVWTAWFRVQTVHGAQAQPFYLERGLYEHQVSGALSMFKKEVVARRSDGTTALIEYEGLNKLPGGTGLPAMRKLTFPDGSEVWLVDQFHLRSSWPKMNSAGAVNVVARVSHPKPNCGMSESAVLGHDNVAGQQTLRTVIKIDATREVMSWLAPDLACEMLTFQQVTTDGTPAKVLTEGRVLMFSTGEPDPELFTIRGDYEEVVPSQLITRRLGAVGIEMDEDTRRMGSQMDRQIRRGAALPEKNDK
jgi:hypothetical protein